MLQRRQLVMGAISTGFFAAPGLLHAQGAYPNRPVRLVVPFPPGGGADIAARIIAAPLGEALGQPIIVENKAGADGLIAAEVIMKAPADGYPLLMGTASGFSGAPVLRKAVPYDPVADFTPISRIGTFVFVLLVNEQVPAKTLSELVAHARANPGKLNYGTGNATAKILTAQLAHNAKLDMVHIPYSGDGPATTETLAGRLQLMFVSGGPVLPHVRAGKLRALAVLIPDRSPLLPEVPTLQQAGMEMNISPWVGLFGPRGLPRDVVERLNRDAVKVLARADVRSQLSNAAFEATSSSPEELRNYVAEQLRDWKRAAQDAGMQAE